MNPIMVAIIDDDPVYQKITQMRLRQKQKDCTILSFADGEEAVNFFKTQDDAGALPDIILLDINMPIMNGWDFLEHFRKLKPFLPKPIRILIVSSSVSHVDIERAEQYSDVSGYLSKPLHEAEFAQILAAAR